MNAQNICENEQFDYTDTLVLETLHIEKFKICPSCNTEAPVSCK